MHANHPERVNNGQLSFLLTLSERPVDDESIDRCPLCPMTLSLPRLYAHIAQHLEHLSLFVLFSYVEDGDTQNGSNASDQAQDHRSDNSSGFSELSDTAGQHEINFSNSYLDRTAADFLESDHTSENTSDWTEILTGTPKLLPSDRDDPILLHLQNTQYGQAEAKPISDTEPGTQIYGEDSSESYTIARMRSFIDKHMKSVSFIGRVQKFLPRLAIERLTTLETIRGILSDSIRLLPLEELLELASKIHSTGPRIFATWLYGPSPPLNALMELYSDDDFPFGRDNPYFNDFTEFLERQQHFNVAFFQAGSFQTLDDRWAIPIDFDPANSSWGSLKNSAYSISIDPEHHSFPMVSHCVECAIFPAHQTRGQKKTSQCVSIVPKIPALYLSNGC